jgi:cellulose synthase/poly-beta-1,6-N-acetylglucosamine synthase-like glycosyltransferase
VWFCSHRCTRERRQQRRRYGIAEIVWFVRIICENDQWSRRPETSKNKIKKIRSKDAQKANQRLLHDLTHVEARNVTLRQVETLTDSHAQNFVHWISSGFFFLFLLVLFVLARCFCFLCFVSAIHRLKSLSLSFFFLPRLIYREYILSYEIWIVIRNV